MLHEAFCLYSQADIFDPYEKHHSTVRDACELAERLGVKNLLLYHTEDRNLADRKRLYTSEGSEYYSGRLWIPDDLDVIEIQ
jgi:ribonuclease Z